MIKVTIQQVRPLLLRQMKAGIVPFLHGKPGIGKSALAQSIADQLKLELIDLRLAEMDPTEISGFPRINPTTGMAEYVPLDLFPLDTWEVPNGKRGWLIIFDEFSSAPKAVQSAAYKILLDRKVGKFKLHDNVLMMAAGNLATDGAIVEPQSSAITSRTANYELVEDHKEWVEWAAGAGVDHRVTSYISFKPSVFHTLNPDAPEQPYACARTWHMVSKCVAGSPITRTEVPLMSSLLGEGVANEFLEFCNIYADLPSIAQIVKAPKSIPLSDRIDIQWALMGSICASVTEKTLKPLAEFLDRMPAELRVVAMRDMFKRQPDLYDLEDAQDWLNRSAEEVF